MAKLDTRYPLVNTDELYLALTEYKTNGLAEEVYPFLRFKLLQTADQLAGAAKHIAEQVRQMDEERAAKRRVRRKK